MKTSNVNTKVIREGSDITLVGWGAQLSIMEQACIDAEKVCALLQNVLLRSQIKYIA